MSTDSAERRQAFERWVSSLRTHPDGAPAALDEQSGVLSLDEQKTLIQHLPRDVVRKLREREAGHKLPADEESTAIFDAPPELLARARRLMPPKKPERSTHPSAPPESPPHPLPTPVVAPPLGAQAVPVTELRQPPLPEMPSAGEPEEPRRASWFGWSIFVLGSGLIAGYAWFVLTR